MCNVPRTIWLHFTGEKETATIFVATIPTGNCREGKHATDATTEVYKDHYDVRAMNDSDVANVRFYGLLLELL